ncbi:hypothetical protein [Streptomyces microflavus]|uniref:hypothetical protein n=1 Tax=Streptomyces microflavus TaxID=1919 RepID=UPI0033E1DC17
MSEARWGGVGQPWICSMRTWAGGTNPMRDPGGSCSWVTVVILGILVLLAVLVHSFFGWVRDLLSALF